MANTANDIKMIVGDGFMFAIGWFAVERSDCKSAKFDTDQICCERVRDWLLSTDIQKQQGDKERCLYTKGMIIVFLIPSVPSIIIH